MQVKSINNKSWREQMLDAIEACKIIKEFHDGLKNYVYSILSNQCECSGITIDEQGWVNFDQLIDSISKENQIDRETLESLIKYDEAQRFIFCKDKTLIRANQGYSVTNGVEK